METRPFHHDGMRSLQGRFDGQASVLPMRPPGTAGAMTSGPKSAE
jgi:hypothetical protein